MNQEIKERVERIQKGKVPEGYKETKVGIIPDDWKTTKLKNTVLFLDSKRKPIKEEERVTLRGIYPYYGASGIIDYVNDYLFDDELILLGEDGANIIMRSTPLAFKITGKTWVNNHAHVLKPNNDMSIDFLTEMLESINYRKYNTGTAQPKLNNDICKNIIVAKPPYDEQKKIGDIILTWDKAIELKEKLIEEKKKFKRGLMQNIISAQMNDDCSRKFTKFKDIFKIIKRPIDKHPEEEYKRLTVKRRLGGVKLRDIKKGKEILVDSQHIVKEGDFIISNRQVFHGAIGVVQKKLENSIISMEYSILRCNEGFDTEFLFYCMYSPQFKKTIIKRTQGIHEEKFVFLFNEWYKTLGLHIPSIDEQKSTVSVLNNLNENIQILTNEVAQLKEQKRGLMQLLLTGIVRVEVD